MVRQENSWVEGPLIRFVERDEVVLRYLYEDTVQECTKNIAGSELLLQLKGAFEDQHHTYTLQKPPVAAAAEQEGIARILLLGDMHGHYDKLVRFLRAQGVLNAENNWQWGAGHLVMCGDVMDRGLAVLPLLWLLCRLEQQAAGAGGAVHVLLGNHELMVMQGDLRYVHPRLLQLYAAAGMSYTEAYGRHWYLGAWLRSRNAVLRLNKLLISHAGISAAVAKHNLRISTINNTIRAGIDKPAGEHAGALLGNAGPLWYRGYVLDKSYYRPADAAQAEEVLDRYGAESMVVAHTPVAGIQQRLQGRVWAIDLDIESPQVAVQSLLFEEGTPFLLGADGSRNRFSTLR